ncbi:Phosphoesterase [Metarhizium album ARSEF 1941]|uniref:Phosphoesterase n=1 Tax=Metarhizium album (strain ARSEF 1941) TaxID=1081103 RepID=A0A0B2X0M6_METAS|nr:Phosphoesterase [Metarhizium album ARSEF 1941]KHN99838.1 Phosphoesterase [Metarhizium album ARSEF 1941]
MHRKLCLPAAALAAATAVQAGSLKDVKHIVLFMQENRAFDHYFGTMAGVRGFGDPNVQNDVDILKPWHINYLGGEWLDATQCMGAGDNGWVAMHSAYSGGLGNNWANADSPYSLGYFKRADIPTHFDIAEGWTVADMASQSILAATDPNRITWMSGSVNIPGSPTNPDGKGGMIIDNSATPGCEAPGLNCFPFVWKTFPEYLEDAGISWQVWQDFDNFEDNMLAYFAQYQTAKTGSALRDKGNSYPGLNAFFQAAARGALPQVSWIVGPQEQSEHPPNLPKDGAWLQKKVVDAITNSPAYNETVLIISYDEQGGWADHVVPVVAPKGTAGEWLKDPYNKFGDVPLGPGWRTPRFIISPWSRGGNVFTEFADHTSDIQFVEEWAAAHGYRGVRTKALTQWRRDHMSNLLNAFDFDNVSTRTSERKKPDYSRPLITPVDTPPSLPDDGSRWTGNLSLGSLTGPWVGAAKCLQDHKTNKPPVPYGKQNADQDMAQLVEQGFKRVRGRLTEGRYLTFEMFGLALTNFNGTVVSVTPATSSHGDARQRWIVHTVGGPGAGNHFYLQSAVDKKYVSAWPVVGLLTSDANKAQAFHITYHPRGSKYSLSLGNRSDAFVKLSPTSRRRSADGSMSGISWAAKAGGFSVYSVSYSS